MWYQYLFLCSRDVKWLGICFIVMREADSSRRICEAAVRSLWKVGIGGKKLKFLNGFGLMNTELHWFWILYLNTTMYKRERLTCLKNLIFEYIDSASQYIDLTKICVHIMITFTCRKSPFPLCVVSFI